MDFYSKVFNPDFVLHGSHYKDNNLLQKVYAMRCNNHANKEAPPKKMGHALILAEVSYLCHAHAATSKYNENTVGNHKITDNNEVALTFRRGKITKICLGAQPTQNVFVGSHYRTHCVGSTYNITQICEAAIETK